MAEPKNDSESARANIVESPGEEDSGAVNVGAGTDTRQDSNVPEIPERLPLLPIRDTVAFPGTVMPLQISREKSKRVLDLALGGSRMIAAVAQRSADTEDPKLEDLYRIGTACIILKMLRMPDGTESIVIHGLRRIGVEAITRESDYLEATVHAYTEPQEETTEQQALVHIIRTSADRIMELSPNIPPEAREVLHSISSPGGLADFLASNLPLGLIHKQELLETFDVTDRLRKINLAVAAQLEVSEMSDKIQRQVKGQLGKTQREYYLREQMKAIQSELGQQDARTETQTNLQEKIKKASMPRKIEEETLKEVERMGHIPVTSPEYGVALDWVECLSDLPWTVSTEDSLDIERAAGILDEDHYGLDKIKKRILEFLAVRTLKKDSRGPILCFTGPPGVGKTSLGRSIARAMNRNFIRVSLGGASDEAAIRGHRRTYIGSMPGRIIRELRRAGSNNPLFMLDEVDKIGQDVRGDPMSALLEVLDPAQNAEFVDHYLGVPFDLSKVFFITTANYMGAVEPALRDRMEIIELDSYTRREKLQIAHRYLLPRQIEENGLSNERIAINDDILALIIEDYTREAGVRTLERKIGAVCRARAASVVRKETIHVDITVEDVRTALGPKDFESEVVAASNIPGIATGLAYTPVGGEILFIEAAKMPGSGQLTLTGQLGDVMRESAVAATSIIRARMGVWNVKPGDYRSFDFHVHVPAGAIPKDGPSAGVAMLAAMISTLTDQPIDSKIGMTGEITLSGRVLPVGGVREKLLGAHRAGLETIIMPARNEPDTGEIPEDIRDSMTFVFIDHIDDLLNYLFDPLDQTAKKKRRKRRAKNKPFKSKRKKKSSKTKVATRTKTPRKSVKKKGATKKTPPRKRRAARGLISNK
ncbi:MAG: endopeptidase La [Planctomycetes bacterium]|nr:endopeptidase La [Planctomycetota bacterium]